MGDKNTLSFHTNRKLTVYGFYNFLHSTNIFYNRIYVLKVFSPIENTPKFQYILYQSLAYTSESDYLIVDQININSPGLFNLKGSGEIPEQIRLFIKDLLFRNKLEKTEMLLRNRNLELKNLKELSDVTNSWVETLRNAGFSDEEIKQSVNYILESGLKMINSMQHNSIELHDNESNDQNSTKKIE